MNDKKPGMALILVSCALLAPSPSGAEGIDVEAIQRAIEEAGAGWTAGHTPQTQMTEEQRDDLIPDGDVVFGPPPLPEELYEASPGTTKGDPPTPDPTASRFSWRDYEGVDWMTEVKDQRTCGGCWAFSSLGATEAAYNIAIGEPHLDIDLSEQTVIACTSGGCDGGMPEPVAQYLRHTGVPDEQCYPYLAIDGRCEDRCSDWTTRAFQISGWGWRPIFLYGEAGVKEYIVRSPLIVSMDVYTDFNAYTGGVYEHVTGEYEGGHSIALVGWDDAHDSWICKNSWGPAWGDGGYFEIKRGDSGFGNHIVYVTVDGSDLDGHPCITPRRQDVEVVSGGLPVSVEVSLVNCGGSHLDWTAEPDPGTGWLSVTPTSGSHAIGEGTTITATIDPATLTRLGPWAGSVLVHGGISDARGHLDINVISAPPAADFEADPTSGPAPLTVRFTNTSAGTVTNTDWDFGDGETGGGRNPEHTYEAEGVYTVSMEVSGPEGRDSLTREDYITVLPPGADPLPEEVPDEVGDGAPDADEDVEDEGPDDGATPGCGCDIVH